MDSEPPVPPHDPEFGSNRPGLLSGRLDGEPEAYLRLVANPFLGFTYFVVWLIVFFQSIFGRMAGPLTPVLLVVLIVGLSLVPMFMNFHCLDCGQTGRLLRWRKHACERAYLRRETGKRRFIRGPTPVVQVILWVWGILVLAMLLNSHNFFAR